MKRAVGYCENHKCDAFTKGVFLLNHGDTFYCPVCRLIGFIERETAIDVDVSSGVYKTVKIEFDYDPINKRYTQIAIVDVNSLKHGGTYTLCSPLIKTEARALKVGENLINLVNSGIKRSDSINGENVVNMDLPFNEFKLQCGEMNLVLEEKERRLRSVQS